MILRHVFSKAVKSTFHVLGMDIVRRKNSPALTLLGLRERSFGTIIDVGANSGQFARHMRGFFPEAKIYCYEPLPGPFVALNKWAISQSGYVHAFNIALGETSGEITMNCHVDHTPSSSLLKATKLNITHHPFMSTQRSQTVSITRLDDALAQTEALLEQDVLLKLDVQGYEEQVLKGATRVLQVVSACVLEVNLDALYEGQANFQTLVSLLSDAGLHYGGNLSQSYGDDGHVMWIDALFRRTE